MQLRSNRVLLWSVLLSAAIVAGWLIYLRIGGSGVSLEAIAEKDTVMPGVPFDLEVRFGNDGKSPFSSVQLSVHLPEGMRADGATGRVAVRPIGDMAIGSLHEETFKLTALPSASGAEQEITVVASYIPGPLSSPFEETTTVKVRVSDTGYAVDLTGPATVLAGEEFDVQASYGRPSTSTEAMPEFSNMELSIVAPKEYVRTKADPETTSGPFGWKIIEDAASASTTPVRLEGSVSLPDLSMFSISAELSAELDGERFVIAEKKLDISIAQSPLSLTIMSTDGEKRSYASGETMHVVLQYKNNASVAFENAMIRATLMGEMFDAASLLTSEGVGLVNRAKGTIVWDRTAVSGFASIAPGVSGEVAFSVRVKNDYPIKRLNDKNFKLRVEAQLTSPTPVPGTTDSRTMSESVLERPVRGKIALDAKGYFRDAAAGVANTGPLPPKVGIPTSFTIHWQLTNFATDMKDIVVKAALEDGVTIGKVLKSNTTPAPEFNEESGEMIWRIDRLSATAGLLTERPEAVFQVIATPRAEHAQRVMPLITGTTLEATDEWSGEKFMNAAGAVTTALPDDPTTSETQGVVLQ